MVCNTRTGFRVWMVCWTRLLLLLCPQPRLRNRSRFCRYATGRALDKLNDVESPRPLERNNLPHPRSDVFHTPRLAGTTPLFLQPDSYPSQSAALTPDCVLSRPVPVHFDVRRPSRDNDPFSILEKTAQRPRRKLWPASRRAMHL